MSNALIGRKLIDCVILEWTEDIESARLLSLTALWVRSDRFLIQRMDGLVRVGYSSLDMEPSKEGRE